MISSCTTDRRRRGFSLTELAIVLGVVGIVLGGVWQIATLGWAKARREQATEEIGTIVTNMRGFYQGQLGVTWVATKNMMPNLFNDGVVPNAMQRTATASCTNTSGLCADTPWGSNKGTGTDATGTFRVCAWNYGLATAQTSCATGGGTAPYFATELAGLSQDDCIHLAAQISTSTNISGIVGVFVNAAAETVPVSVDTASGDCAAGSSNVVAFVYRLSGS